MFKRAFKFSRENVRDSILCVINYGKSIRLTDADSVKQQSFLKKRKRSNTENCKLWQNSRLLFVGDDNGDNGDDQENHANDDQSNNKTQVVRVAF